MEAERDLSGVVGARPGRREAGADRLRRLPSWIAADGSRPARLSLRRLRASAVAPGSPRAMACVKVEIDIDFLRDGVLVDLYAVVRSAVRVSQESYSISSSRSIWATTSGGPGGDSGRFHRRLSRVRPGGRRRADRRGRPLLAAIRDYNATTACPRSVCGTGCSQVPGVGRVASERRPRRSVTSRARRGDAPVGNGIRQEAAPAGPTRGPRPRRRRSRLRDLLGTRPRTSDPTREALALVAAGLQFNRRESKPFWWRHFGRLRHPVDEWAGHPTTSSPSPRSRSFGTGSKRASAHLPPDPRLTAPADPDTPAPASARAVMPNHDAPAPAAFRRSPTIRVAPTSVTVTAVAVSGEPAADRRGRTPGEIRPGRRHAARSRPQPGGDRNIDSALLGSGAVRCHGPPAHNPGTRHPPAQRAPPALRAPLLPAGFGRFPRINTLAPSPPQCSTSIPPISRCRDHRHRKTHVAAQVIRDLVARHGWKVGVVAQSHAAVENVLDAAVRAGLDPHLVGKPVAASGRDPWTDLPDRQLALRLRKRADGGYLLSGALCDFTHRGRVTRGQRTSLSSRGGPAYSPGTLACSRRRPTTPAPPATRQLPEVVRARSGTHPGVGPRVAHRGRPGSCRPIAATSATTWRLHPRLAERVSIWRMPSLTAHPHHDRPLTDRGRGRSARAPRRAPRQHRQLRPEAAVVADLGGICSDGRGSTPATQASSCLPWRRLTSSSSTPNAQVARLRGALEAAGWARGAGRHGHRQVPGAEGGRRADLDGRLGPPDAPSWGWVPPPPPPQRRPASRGKWAWPISSVHPS